MYMTLYQNLSQHMTLNLSISHISQGCGKDLTLIEKDTSRVRYLSPEEGVEYGLIDKVLYPEELRAQVRRRNRRG